jgi:hypothetical protein
MADISIKRIDGTKWDSKDKCVKLKLVTTDDGELILNFAQDQIYRLISQLAYANTAAEKALETGDNKKFPLLDTDVAEPTDNRLSDERLLVVQFDHGGYLRFDLPEKAANKLLQRLERTKRPALGRRH